MLQLVKTITAQPDPVGFFKSVPVVVKGQVGHEIYSRMIQNDSLATLSAKFTSIFPTEGDVGRFSIDVNGTTNKHFKSNAQLLLFAICITDVLLYKDQKKNIRPNEELLKQANTCKSFKNNNLAEHLKHLNSKERNSISAQAKLTGVGLAGKEFIDQLMDAIGDDESTTNTTTTTTTTTTSTKQTVVPDASSSDPVVSEKKSKREKKKAKAEAAKAEAAEEVPKVVSKINPPSNTKTGKSPSGSQNGPNEDDDEEEQPKFEVNREGKRQVQVAPSTGVSDGDGMVGAHSITFRVLDGSKAKFVIKLSGSTNVTVAALFEAMLGHKLNIELPKVVLTQSFGANGSIENELKAPYDKTLEPNKNQTYLDVIGAPKKGFLILSREALIESLKKIGWSFANNVPKEQRKPSVNPIKAKAKDVGSGEPTLSGPANNGISYTGAIRVGETNTAARKDLTEFLKTYKHEEPVRLLDVIKAMNEANGSDYTLNSPWDKLSMDVSVLKAMVNKLEFAPVDGEGSLIGQAFRQPHKGTTLVDVSQYDRFTIQAITGSTVLPRFFGVPDSVFVDTSPPLPFKLSEDRKTLFLDFMDKVYAADCTVFKRLAAVEAVHKIDPKYVICPLAGSTGAIKKVRINGVVFEGKQLPKTLDECIFKAESLTIDSYVSELVSLSGGFTILAQFNRGMASNHAELLSIFVESSCFQQQSNVALVVPCFDEQAKYVNDTSEQGQANLRAAREMDNAVTLELITSWLRVISTTHRGYALALIDAKYLSQLANTFSRNGYIHWIQSKVFSIQKLLGSCALFTCFVDKPTPGQKVDLRRISLLMRGDMRCLDMDEASKSGVVQTFLGPLPLVASRGISIAFDFGNYQTNEDAKVDLLSILPNGPRKDMLRGAHRTMGLAINEFPIQLLGERLIEYVGGTADIKHKAVKITKGSVPFPFVNIILSVSNLFIDLLETVGDNIVKHVPAFVLNEQGKVVANAAYRW